MEKKGEPIRALHREQTILDSLITTYPNELIKEGVKVWPR